MLMASLAPALLWFGGLYLYSLRPLPPLPQPTGHEIAWTGAEWSHLAADGERCILANNIWNKNAAGLLQEILDQEKAANETLTKLARAGSNKEALEDSEKKGSEEASDDGSGIPRRGIRPVGIGRNRVFPIPR